MTRAPLPFDTFRAPRQSSHDLQMYGNTPATPIFETIFSSRASGRSL